MAEIAWLGVGFARTRKHGPTLHSAGTSRQSYVEAVALTFDDCYLHCTYLQTGSHQALRGVHKTSALRGPSNGMLPSSRKMATSTSSLLWVSTRRRSRQVSTSWSAVQGREMRNGQISLIQSVSKDFELYSAKGETCKAQLRCQVTAKARKGASQHRLNLNDLSFTLRRACDKPAPTVLSLISCNAMLRPD